MNAMSDDFRIEDMTEQECWEILDRERFGRLAVAVHGDPDIFPVNFLVDGGNGCSCAPRRHQAHRARHQRRGRRRVRRS
jgi:nitroimidazol reductase NimA-like FMN-containing flavoprotein (pyridoxamine 5'-phosphate oxidase superfamily)